MPAVLRVQHERGWAHQLAGKVHRDRPQAASQAGAPQGEGDVGQPGVPNVPLDGVGADGRRRRNHLEPDGERAGCVGNVGGVGGAERSAAVLIRLGETAVLRVDDIGTWER
eukprot:6181584-Pleurochrysis_carterae.AAC.1